MGWLKAWESEWSEWSFGHLLSVYLAATIDQGLKWIPSRYVETIWEEHQKLKADVKPPLPYELFGGCRYKHGQPPKKKLKSFWTGLKFFVRLARLRKKSLPLYS
jgi:hypothetical protein